MRKVWPILPLCRALQVDCSHYAPLRSPLQPSSQHQTPGALADEEATNHATSESFLRAMQQQLHSPHRLWASLPTHRLPRGDWATTTQTRGASLERRLVRRVSQVIISVQYMLGLGKVGCDCFRLAPARGNTALLNNCTQETHHSSLIIR